MRNEKSKSYTTQFINEGQSKNQEQIQRDLFFNYFTFKTTSNQTSKSFAAVENNFYKNIFERVPFTFLSAGSSSSNVIFLFFGALFFIGPFPPLPPFLSFNFLKRASRSSLIAWNAFAASSPSNATNSTFSAPRIWTKCKR